MATYSSCMGLLGLYIGQVVFRYSGSGRLDFTAYTSKPGLKHQIIAAALICVLYMVPYWLSCAFGENLQLWAWAIFLVALPRLIMGIILSLFLPRISMKIANYPEVLPEVTETTDAYDPEKGKELRTFQIKGKFSIKFHVDF